MLHSWVMVLVDPDVWAFVNFADDLISYFFGPSVGLPFCILYIALMPF